MPTVDFGKFSKSVVEGFLQTVVVLDDRAFMTPNENGGEIVEPDPNMPILDDEADATATPVAPDKALDARTLIESFASRGLVCAVLLPAAGQDMTAPTLRASHRADIVVLDWQLGDNGEKATQIIRELLAHDERSGGRLRMIVIYTASPELEKIRDRIRAELTQFKDADGAVKLGIALTSKHSRIAFLQKGKASVRQDALGEGDLPERLISEFTELVRGLLANVALASIAAIRDETHQVLARLHAGLDAPFLTHRLLQVTPEDAEGYVVDLLSSEFQTILQSRGIGRTHAGRDVIEGALTEWERAGKTFRLMKAKDDEREPYIIKAADVMKLVDSGPAGLESIENVKVSKDKLYERLYILLENDWQSGLGRHYEFARTTAHSRETATCAAEWVPHLNLGTIVRNGADHWICIQPLCDTLRLDTDTQFIFAPLNINQNRFDIVVRSSDDEDTCLKLNSRACAIKSVTFAPDQASRIVQATRNGAERIFTSTDGDEYIWVADLRTSFAQRMVHQIATNLSRIGLDEFEWLRRHS